MTTTELAAHINQPEKRLVEKLLAMNGQVNYNPEQPELSDHQLRVILNKYLTGTRPLQGENRKAAEQLLKQLKEPVEASKPEPVAEIPEPKKKPVSKLANKPVPEPVQELVEEPANFKITKENWPYLAGSLLVVFAQATHYAYLEQLESPLTGWQSVVSSWSVALIFELLILLMAVKSSNRIKAKTTWLVVFGFVALLMNLSFYGLLETDKARKIILSIALPVASVAMAHFFTSSKK